MTTDFSNAVLLAVLPHVSDFAAKLQLPIPQPVAIQQVGRCGIAPVKDETSVGLWLTNHYWFHVDHRGFVDGFRAPTNVFVAEGPDLGKYFGRNRMTTNEVVAAARETLTKLGYKPELFHSSEVPTLDGPVDTQQGSIPYCQVTWQWPKGENGTAMSDYVNIQINTETKEIVGLQFFLRNISGLAIIPLKIGAKPELEKDYQKRIKPKMVFDSNAPPQGSH